MGWLDVTVMSILFVKVNKFLIPCIPSDAKLHGLPIRCPTKPNRGKQMMTFLSHTKSMPTTAHKIVVVTLPIHPFRKGGVIVRHDETVFMSLLKCLHLFK